MPKSWKKAGAKDNNTFVQRYYSEALDAAVLLIPLMGFLPADDPRVAGTIAAIERELTIDSLVYRFDPGVTLGGDQLPLGEFEGAFLPVTFWFAHALAESRPRGPSRGDPEAVRSHGRRVGPVCRGDRRAPTNFSRQHAAFIRARRICSRCPRSGRSPRPRQ